MWYVVEFDKEAMCETRDSRFSNFTHPREGGLRNLIIFFLNDGFPKSATLIDKTITKGSS